MGTSLRWAACKTVVVSGSLALGDIAFRLVHPGTNDRPAVILGQLILADSRAVAEDDGKAALEGDAVGADLPQQSFGIPGLQGVIRLGELASDSASALAFAAAYCESSSETRVESWRSCEAGCENQRSMERLSSPKLNRNMNTAGANESSRAPTSIRLRILEPSTRLRWSASSFTMLRKSRTSKVSSSRNAMTESAVNRKIWPVPWGRRNGGRGLKAFSAASASSKQEHASAERYDRTPAVLGLCSHACLTAYSAAPDSTASTPGNKAAGARSSSPAGRCQVPGFMRRVRTPSASGRETAAYVCDLQRSSS